MSDLSTTPRFVDTHFADDVPGPRYIATIDDALRNGIVVAFWMCRGDARPMFKLRGFRGVVHVVDHRERHLGTFADTAAALSRGWDCGAMPWDDEQGGAAVGRRRGRGLK